MKTPVAAELAARAAWDAYFAACRTHPDEDRYTLRPKPHESVLRALDVAYAANVVYHQAVAAEDAAAHLRCPTAWARILSDEYTP